MFGPETHMTAIVGMALGKKAIQKPVRQQSTTANFLLPTEQVGIDQLAGWTLTVYCNVINVFTQTQWHYE